MEEEKAAAYYEELTRKGEGAARFKQGLGFSSTSDDAVPVRGSALPSSSSFLSSFVRASSPTTASKFEKEAQLVNIQNKLKKKPSPSNSDRIRDKDRHNSGHRHRSRSPSRDDRRSRRHRSSSRDRDRERRRRRSPSRSISDDDRDRRRKRSSSPRNRRSDKVRGNGAIVKAKDSGTDYAKLIEGYNKMTPAEKVKAKLKLQLSETAKKDATNGMGSGWERFDFDKDAPLDDEEIEAAEDDVELVKHIGQSFRLNAVKARKEDEIKAAHDEAMFGASSVLPSANTDSAREEDDFQNMPSAETIPATNLISNQVLAMQKGSWRDRVGKK